MTGWRLGYAVWPKDLAEHATRLAINIHSCVNAATQYAGIEALKGPQDAVDRMVAAFDERRQVIVERLNQLPGFRCTRPGGAFYVLPNLTRTGRSARDLQDTLLSEVGVALVAGTSYGDQGEGYIRFSYANSVENIERAIDRIDRFLAG
jgi:aspartate/methionine/tyrosine aminotransferase